MPASHQRKRSAANVTAVKIGLTVAAVGASVAGWATLGATQLHTTVATAEVTSAIQSQALQIQPTATQAPTTAALVSPQEQVVPKATPPATPTVNPTQVT